MEAKGNQSHLQEGKNPISKRKWTHCIEYTVWIIKRSKNKGSTTHSPLSILKVPNFYVTGIYYNPCKIKGSLSHHFADFQCVGKIQKVEVYDFCLPQNWQVQMNFYLRN